MKDKTAIIIKAVKAKQNDCIGCILEDASCSERKVFIKAGLPDCTTTDIIYKVVEDER